MCIPAGQWQRKSSLAWAKELCSTLRKRRRWEHRHSSNCKQELRCLFKNITMMNHRVSIGYLIFHSWSEKYFSQPVNPLKQIMHILLHFLRRHYIIVKNNVNTYFCQQLHPAAASNCAWMILYLFVVLQYLNTSNKEQAKWFLAKKQDSEVLPC